MATSSTPSLSFNLTEILIEAIRAPEAKFIIVFLVFLLAYLLHKFFGFFDKRIAQFESVVKSLQDGMSSHEAVVKKLFEDNALKLNDFKIELMKDLHKSKEDMMLVRFEMLKDVEHAKTEMAQLQVQVLRVGAGMPSVQAAITDYQKRIDILESNFTNMIEALKRREAMKK